MSGVWFRARAELRARWRSWLALAVLLGVAGGVALTTAAGARRTRGVFERLIVTTKAHDVVVQENGDPDPRLLDRIARLPQVAVAGKLAVIPSDVATDSAAPFSWSVTAAARADDTIGVALDVPRLIAGRYANPKEPDEAMVDTAFLRTRGLKLGDTFTIRTVTFDELLALFQGRLPKPTGPMVNLRIVGVQQLPDEVGFTQENRGLMMLTQQFYRTYRERLANLEILMVRLRRGERDLGPFSAQAQSLAGPEQQLGITGGTSLASQVHDALQTQSTALWVFTLVVGSAAFLLIGQALARAVSISGKDDAVLAALGAGRGALIAGAMVPVAIVAAIGAMIAVITAIPASAVMPLGYARGLEPSLGVRFDPLVLGIGGAVTAGLICVRGAIVATWITRKASAERRPSPAAVPRVLTRAGASAPMMSGWIFAFEPGPSAPIRGVLAGIVAGIIAMTAAVTFDASFNHLLAEPRAYGFAWDAMVAGGEDPAVATERENQLAASSLVSEYAATVHTVLRFRGSDFPTMSVRSLRGAIAPRIVEGRGPRTKDEVALGLISMRDARVRIGADIEFPGRAAACSTEKDCRVRFHVTGRALFWDVDGRPGVGAVFTPEGQARVDATNAPATDLLVRLARGATAERLRSSLGLEEGEVISAHAPTDVQNLGRARGLNAGLSAVLAVFSLATTAAALITSVTRRARDLAILKVLGFVRSQVRRTIAWQATSMIGVALALGVPLGMMGGRWLWAALANGLAVANEPAIPAAFVGIGAVGLVLLANLVAVWPGRRAARTQPARVLRSE